MTILEKLAAINTPKVETIGSGTFNSISELWVSFVEPRLPKTDTVLAWHRVLMEYVRRPDAVFPVRGYNSVPSAEDYGLLRRGFLTHTDDGYSFFYTDNFHAAYYLKMAMDGFVPDVDSLLSAYQNREFPARFGRDTQEERDLMAMPRGKDPGIQKAGFLIAHVYDVGKSYMENGRSLSLRRNILDVHFPRGEREDWHAAMDAKTAEPYLVRELHVEPEARKYLVAAFLRFVHPFNYILMPKRSVCSVDISGNAALLSYVRCKFRERYGAAYKEFEDLIMPTNTASETLQDAVLTNYYYGNGIALDELMDIENEEETEVAPDSDEMRKVGQIASSELVDKLKHISLKEAELFTSLEYSREKFNLSFPLLSEVREPDHNGVYRYYATSFCIQGKKYYLTSQWYERQRSHLLRWLATH